MSNPKEWTTDPGLSGLVQALSGGLRQRPAGRLMKRILREHPHASFEEATQLFRDVALDDPEVFDDLLAEVFKRHLPKIENVGKTDAVMSKETAPKWANVRRVTKWRSP